jgi:hypothetical protein
MKIVFYQQLRDSKDGTIFSPIMAHTVFSIYKKLGTLEDRILRISLLPEVNDYNGTVGPSEIEQHSMILDDGARFIIYEDADIEWIYNQMKGNT